MSVPETAVESDVPGLVSDVPGVPSSYWLVPVSVRLPVTVFDPIELPGAQMPALDTVLPAPMLMVPIPRTVWPLVNANVPVLAVRSRRAPDEPASPTVTVPLLANEPAEPRARLPPEIVVAPV